MRNLLNRYLPGWEEKIESELVGSYEQRQIDRIRLTGRLAREAFAHHLQEVFDADYPERSGTGTWYLEITSQELDDASEELEYIDTSLKIRIADHEQLYSADIDISPTGNVPIDWSEFVCEDVLYRLSEKVTELSNERIASERAA